MFEQLTPPPFPPPTMLRCKAKRQFNLFKTEKRKFFCNNFQEFELMVCWLLKELEKLFQAYSCVKDKKKGGEKDPK